MDTTVSAVELRSRLAHGEDIRLVAGTIVAASVLAGLAVPGAIAVAGLVGAGLVLAALTDTCAMGDLLARLPYNRGSRCDVRAVVRELTDPSAA